MKHDTIHNILRTVKSLNYMYTANCTLTINKNQITVTYKGETMTSNIDDSVTLYELFDWIDEHYRNGNYEED